jgi:hypothetical protein
MKTAYEIGRLHKFAPFNRQKTKPMSAIEIYRQLTRNGGIA